MTELNVEQLNEVASGAVTSVLEQVEAGQLTDEDLLGDLYGKMVAAHALGWDIATMMEDAQAAGDRLIGAIETITQESEQE